MTKELYYIRFLQFSVLALTLILLYSISLASKGRIDLHKKINLAVMSICAVAVAGLVGSILMGWDYSTLKTSEALINVGPESMRHRLMIHRSFSAPLFLLLVATLWTGWRNQALWHRRLARVALFFWFGTLISAWLFF